MKPAPARAIDAHTEVLEVDMPGRATPPVALSLSELLTREFTPRRILLGPWLSSQSLNMIYGIRGVAKTHVALGVAYALASGGRFLGWTAPEPVPVLYLDGEMPGASLRERVARIVESAPEEPPDDFLRFVTPDCQEFGVMPDLATHEGQYAVDKVIDGAQVIIVDNLSCLVRRSGKENDAESWLSVAEWSLRQRAAGRSVIFIHHAGKSGQQRGTSKREDLLDTSILLKRPSDYTADEGARFEVHFEKARALFGEDVDPIEAKLTTDANGAQKWEIHAAAESADRQMIELAELGLAQADIARELGCHRSTVLRGLKKAAEEGRYKPPKEPRRGA